ncbi:MAG: ATP-binding protein [Halioglobus sp.]|nr:ATP-binding protein [Halioglobus sp.]
MNYEKPSADDQTDVANQAIQRHRYLEILHRFTLSQEPLKSVEDICWNIAKTAIAELGFLDCVVYLVDEDNEYLFQVAAHGPKNPDQRLIASPLKIKVGEGVVGHVACTGEAQIISDTRQDSRYILDDEFRLSELAVPITHQERVIGVLDSEHPDADFFSTEDVQLFKTIAALASNRIDTAIAMERLEQAVLVLSEKEAELKSQALDLTKARRSAESASEAKSRFLANMTHEIRTPMTSIVGYADLLSAGELDDVQKIKWRRQLISSTRHLQELIGNVLDVAAVEAGKATLDLDRISLTDFLDDCVENQRPRAKSKDLELIIDYQGTVPTEVVVDRVKVRQILTNLISNALKYTEEGYVKVTVSAAPVNSGCKLIFQIEDTGCGMAPELINEAFLPFSRLHKTSNANEIEGAGLGLALVTSLLKLMQGSLEAQSEEGRGTTFTIALDVALSPDAQWIKPGAEVLEYSRDMTPSGGSEAALDGWRILLCEDSVSIAELLMIILKQQGAQVDHVTNGALALECYKKMMKQNSPPDLVIMDMQMPIMDGYEAATKLKALKIECPLVALTAQAIKGDESRCISAGCDFYMTKPIDVATFPEKLRKIRNAVNSG